MSRRWKSRFHFVKWQRCKQDHQSHFNLHHNHWSRPHQMSFSSGWPLDSELLVACLNMPSSLALEWSVSHLSYCLFFRFLWVVFAILSFSLYPLSCLCLCIFWVVTMTVMAWQNTNTWCILSTSGVFRGRPWERAVWTCHGRCGESREELPFIKQGFRWSQNDNVNFQWTLWRNCIELPLIVV